jgi:hypothetical protein
MPTRVRKQAPPTGSANDDIAAWRDKQPAITITDPEGIFPSGDENLNAAPTAREFDEVPPKIPSPLRVKARGLREKLRETLNQPTGKKTTKPRVPVSDLISGAWGLLSQFVGQVNPVVSRVLAVQAPVAGMLLEDTVKNTVVDKVLQPVARMATGGEMAMALLGPPILMGYISKQMTTAEKNAGDEKKVHECQRRVAAVTPVLRYSMKSWIKLAGPKLEIMAKEEAEFEQKYGADIDRMINFFLTGTLPTDPQAT